jgi:hypothetical protein
MSNFPSVGKICRDFFRQKYRGDEINTRGFCDSGNWQLDKPGEDKVGSQSFPKILNAVYPVGKKV